jgi:hypothetical protein
VFAVAFAASAGRKRKPEKWTSPGNDDFGEGDRSAMMEADMMEAEATITGASVEAYFVTTGRGM